MTRHVVEVPPRLSGLSDMPWIFDRRGTGLGNNLSGVSVSTFSKFPIWRGHLKMTLTGGEIAEWRALQSQVRGRHGLYAIEMIDPAVFRADEATAALGIGVNGFPFSDSAFFSDGSGFEFMPVCHAVGNHSVGARQLLLDVTQSGVPPKIGQIMSAGDYPFIVEQITPSGGTQYRVQIGSPCLRVDLMHGAEVRHVARGLYEAVEDTGGEPVYDGNWSAKVQLELREALRR